MKSILLTLSLATLHAVVLHASGIPEPGIILYGGVTNVVGTVARPMNQGVLRWEVSSGDGTQRLNLEAVVSGGRFWKRAPDHAGIRGLVKALVEQMPDGQS
jgi:hypothetical protein